jgi:hypothetical protein
MLTRTRRGLKLDPNDDLESFSQQTGVMMMSEDSVGAGSGSAADDRDRDRDSGRYRDNNSDRNSDRDRDRDNNRDRNRDRNRGSDRDNNRDSDSDRNRNRTSDRNLRKPKSDNQQQTNQNQTKATKTASRATKAKPIPKPAGAKPTITKVRTNPKAKVVRGNKSEEDMFDLQEEKDKHNKIFSQSLSLSHSSLVSTDPPRSLDESAAGKGSSLDMEHENENENQAQKGGRTRSKPTLKKQKLIDIQHEDPLPPTKAIVSKTATTKKPKRAPLGEKSNNKSNSAPQQQLVHNNKKPFVAATTKTTDFTNGKQPTTTKPYAHVKPPQQQHQEKEKGLSHTKDKDYTRGEGDEDENVRFFLDFVFPPPTLGCPVKFHISGHTATL